MPHISTLKKWIRWRILFALSIFVAALLGLWLFKGRTNGERQMSSVSTDLSTPKYFRHTAKLQGPLVASIESDRDEVPADGEVFVLRGRVESSEDLAQAKVKWSLGPGVELVSGQTEFVLSPMKAYAAQDFEITLRRVGNTSMPVHLMASGVDVGQRFTATASYHPIQQKILNADKAALLERTKQDLEIKGIKFKLIY